LSLSVPDLARAREAPHLLLTFTLADHLE